MIQQNTIASKNLGANINMLKSKSIMERFMKSKGGGENKPTGALKAISSGTFKNQRLRKPLNQLEKSKSIMIMEDLCGTDKFPNTRTSDQSVSEELSLRKRPPDPGIQPEVRGSNSEM